MCIVESMKCDIEVQNRNLGQDEEMAWYSWRQVASLQLDFLRNIFPPKKDMEAIVKNTMIMFISRLHLSSEVKVLGMRIGFLQQVGSLLKHVQVNRLV